MPNNISGMQPELELDAAHNNTFLHNISYANEDSGVTNYNGSSGNMFIGNLLYGNGDHGIDNYNAPYQTLIGNTAQGNHTAGFNFEGDNGTGSRGAMLRNNISVDNGLNPITGQKSNIRVDASSVSGTSIDYDLVYLSGGGTVEIQWNGTNYSTLAAFQAAIPGQEVHGLQADPLFVAPVAPAGRPPNLVVGDYHIQAGSPAIDSAYADAPGEPIIDLDGNPRLDDPTTTNTGAGVRTYDDRGVYEFQPGGVAPTPTNTSLPTATATANPNFTPTGTPLPTFTPTITFTPMPTVASSSLTFIANADSYVREASGSNYGTSAQLWMDGDVGASYESYLKFTVSGITGTVQSATLRVYSTSSTVDGPPVYATANDWTETGISGNALPALTSSVLDDKGAIASGIWNEYNVTAEITGDGTYSFAFIPTSTDAVSFSSREGSQPSQLVITSAFQSVTATSSATPTFTPTNTPSPTATTTGIPTFTPTNTPLPTATATGIPSLTPTNTPLPTATATGIPSLTPTNTPLLTATATGIPSFTPTNTPLPTATATGIPSFTPTGTPLPTFTPTITFTPMPTVASSSLTFIANADSYVREASGSNYGTSAQLWVDGDVGASYESYLKFTVSGITGTVQSATLRVYSTSSTVDGPPVYATANDWTETGISGNALPALTSSVLDDKGAIASGIWNEYNVTAEITGDGTYSFAFIPTSTDAVSFSSREGSQPSQLVITIAP